MNKIEHFSKVSLSAPPTDKRIVVCMEHQHPPDKVVRVAERDRLVYYKQKADAGYWDMHWDKLIRPEFYVGALEGQLGQFEELFTNYLPADDRILEAGCGPGQWVIALRQRGYNIEGVDWAKETIEKVNRIFPDLPIQSGDVCALEVEDGFYGGYISLGVVEHRAEGPEPFLSEAFRVLKSGGVAIISVPWFNPLRILKAWAGCFKVNEVKGMEFYQYAFRASEMKNHLTSAGFNIIESKSSLNIKMGFEDELPFLDCIYRINILGRILKRLIRRGRATARYFGHMRTYVCMKP